MGLYTFVFQFKGGTYISQFTANTEAEAIYRWLENPEDEMLSGIGFIEKKVIWISMVRSKINEFGYVPLDGLKSAWCRSMTIGRSQGHLNFFKTSDS